MSALSVRHGADEYARRHEAELLKKLRKDVSRAFIRYALVRD